MEILGIGPSELVFIVLIALILLGPKDMVAAGRTFGKMLRKIVTSPTWKAVRTTGHELQQLPTRLMRDAGLDELQDLDKEVREAAGTIDPRRIVRSFDVPPIPPTPAPFSETDSPSEPDPGAESPPENPQA